MPCFKGLAVSIHTPSGPLAEMGINKYARASRITSYIPVPPAKIPEGSQKNKPEQSTFAISITLLTPGLTVPYSTPKPTADDPYPQPRMVGQLPGSGWSSGERGRYFSSVPPYVPRTSNPNETIAAYIYFDGRAKEEVATLLRRGEETWVNSRWVSVPESEGGGLAEREFLFREVGLERWLNGLDLEGTVDKAERIERRQRRLEKKRKKKRDGMGACDTEERTDGKGVLRYGGDGGSPVEDLEEEKHGFFSSDSDSDDEPPQPEAAGQIKIALFRVLASGEIKRGEYSPQFGAHDDDDDDANGNGQSNGNGGDGDADHMTSFAKPKTLDPSSISTQTVTGLDPPESPYAVFTFFYRGDKQLRKMGLIKSTATDDSPVPAKRKSTGPDFSGLGPLKATGTKGFSGYRDTTTGKRKPNDKSEDAMDSDNDDDDDTRQVPNGNEQAEDKQVDDSLLSPDDVKRQGEIAEGVEKMKLKRQHSAEPLSDHGSAWKSPHLKHEDSPPGGTPQSINSVSAVAGTPPPNRSPTHDNGLESIGSPFKRHRASVPSDLDNSLFSLNANQNPLPSTTASEANDATNPTTNTTSSEATKSDVATKMDEDEEL